MYHSITIGEKNTWDDWHLIPTSRPLVNPPKAKMSFVDIPGADGTLDLSTVLTGQVLFSDRVGSWEFAVENGFREWQILYSEIMAYLHGNKFKIILEDDPNYYYEGRLSVNAWNSQKDWSTIVIDYELNPYKKYNSVEGAWIWDTFNFETDIIRYYKDLTVDGELNLTVFGDRMKIIPTIFVSAPMEVTYNGTKYKLKVGGNKIENIILEPGKNRMLFSGKGKVDIEFIGGLL